MTALVVVAAGWASLLAAAVWCGWRWQRVMAAAAEEDAIHAHTAPPVADEPRETASGPQTAIDALELWYLLPAYERNP